MENLIKEATEFTPEIKFDCEANECSVIGMSRPENVNVFFNPLIEWMNKYTETVKEDFNKGNVYGIIVNFRLTYFNSASAKKIWELLNILDKTHASGVEITVNWYYEEDDETILEGGEELEDAIDLNFNYIEEEEE